MKQTITFLLVILLYTGICCAQSSWRGLTPGQSTKNAVTRMLGQAVREVSETLAEYQADNATEKIFVQYRRDTTIIERIERVYPDTRQRDEVLRDLRLPAHATAAHVSSRGRYEEYFATDCIVLTYSADGIDSGVSRVGYYSRELFDSAAANVPRAPRDTPVTAGSSGADPSDLRAPAPRDHRRATTTSTATSNGELVGVALPDRGDETDSDKPQRRFQEELRALMTRDSAARQPPEERNSSVSLTLSENSPTQESLAGEYEFDSPDLPSLRRVTVLERDGKLLWNTTGGSYPLQASGVAVTRSATGQKESDILSFRLVGKPGVFLSFVLANGRVVEVQYSQEVGGQMISALGKPQL